MNMRAQVPVPRAAAPTHSLTRAPMRLLQRKCACGGSAGPDGRCAGCAGSKRLQRQPPGSVRSPIAPAIVKEVLRSPGQPLDTQTRAFFEPRFGHDFSKVRLHADARAAESARAVNAIAYTVGSDIVFGMGRHQPATRAGRELLAHELTHVVQQAGASESATLRIGSSSDHLERAADAAAARAMGGNTSLPIHQGALSVQRQAVGEDAAAAASAPAPNQQTMDPGAATQTAPSAETSTETAETCPAPEDVKKDCATDMPSPSSATNTILFKVDSDDLDKATPSSAKWPTAKAELDDIAATWNKGGASGMIRVDGYASVEYRCGYNWRLSCRRAKAVRDRLENQGDRSNRVPRANILLVAHGASDEAGPTLAANRRVTIAVPAAPPVPAPSPTPTPGPAPAPTPRPSGPTRFASPIDFWINAFIPITVPGAMAVPAGPFAGKHFFPGPFHPFHRNSCFETDERLFTPSAAAGAANSRVQLTGRLNTAPPPAVTSSITTGVTDEIDCTTGALKCHAVPKFATGVSLLGAPGNLIVLLVSAAGNDPCVAGSPDLSVRGLIKVDCVARTLEFVGETTAFPAFEMYADFGSGPATIFTRPPIINSVAGLFVPVPLSKLVHF
jgi:outer membrane protein OmpA-like peptidoglycan-associated protein